MICCNHNCNQGRTCPLRKEEPMIATVLALTIGAIIGVGTLVLIAYVLAHIQG